MPKILVMDNMAFYEYRKYNLIVQTVLSAKSIFVNK